MDVTYTKTMPEVIVPAKDEIRKIRHISVDLENETITVGFPPIGSLGIYSMTKDDVTYWTNYLTDKLSSDETIKNTNITTKEPL